MAGLAAACSGGGEALDAAATRRVVERALVELQGSAPEAAREIEQLLTSADAATARAAAQPRSTGRRHHAVAAWCKVTVEASRALRIARTDEAVRRARFLEAAAGASGRVASARASLRRPGMGRKEAAAATQAEAQLEHARRLAEARRWDDATAAAERAGELAAGPIESFEARERRFFDHEALRQWRQAADSTIEESRRRGTTVIVVDKYHRRLDVYRKGLRAATFTVELGATGSSARPSPETVRLRRATTG